MERPSIGATSAISSFALTLVTMATLGVGLAALQGAPVRNVQQLVVMGTLVAWPFVFFAHYAGSRWVGVSPTPFLDSLVHRTGIFASAIGIPAGGILAIPNAVLGIGVAILLLPDITRPEGIPLTGLDAVDTFRANLVILQEELIFRDILLFPLLALLGVRAADRRRLPSAAVWIGIVITGLAFGYAHVGVAEMIGADRGQYLVFALVQKGLVAGTIFGYVAWRWGVEASMYSHYTMNLVLVLLALASS